MATGQELAALAERHNAVVLLEPFFRGFPASAKRTRLFLEEVGSPRIRALLDPANLIEANDLEEMFGQLGRYTNCLHAKDRKLHVDRGVPAGQGDLDYRHFCHAGRQAHSARPAHSRIRGTCRLPTGPGPSPKGDAAIGHRGAHRLISS